MQQELGNKPIGALLLKFSIPAIIGMLVNALYNIVDRIYIGRLEPLAMSGIGISLPLTILIMGFGMLIGIGGGARISIRLGQKRQDLAELILGNAVTLLVIIMALVTFFGLAFKTQLLYFFGASEATIGYANDYITIILAGSIFQGLGFGLNNIIRSEGSPKIAMYTMLIGALTNILLDPLFIFVFKMGIKGAAIATVISQIISATWVLAHFLLKKSKLHFHKENLKLKKDIVLSILSIGVSPFSMQVAASIVTIISNNALKTHGGDIALSAMTAINSVALFFLMPIFGINQGAQPILGYNYGAKQYDRVKKTLALAITAATVICMTAFVLTQFFTVGMIKLFNSDPVLIEVAKPGMKLFLCMLPVIGFQIISANYFQATGQAPKAMFLSLLRQVILLIPLLLILPNVTNLGLKGVWLAGPIADFSASVVTFAFLVVAFKKLKNESPQLQAEADTL